MFFYQRRGKVTPDMSKKETGVEEYGRREAEEGHQGKTRWECTNQGREEASFPLPVLRELPGNVDHCVSSKIRTGGF